MISIIVPAYNARGTIRECLQSLTNQSNPGQETEIIVVNDGSKDETESIVREFSSVRLINQPNQGPAAARNRGVQEARGEIVLFTDSDCVVSENWLHEMMVPFLSRTNVVGVKGAYRTRQPEWVARFVQIEYEDKYDYMKRNPTIDFIDTYSAGFKRDVFLSEGGYDTSFPVACAEDVELSYRLANKGCILVFNPNAIVYHIHPNGFVAYIKKKYKFAFWRMLAVKKNPNKAIRDSHTPQVLKLQLMVWPALLACIGVAAWSGSWAPIWIVFGCFFLSTTPFAAKALKKDIVVGVLSPFMLLARSAAQFLGVAMGVFQAKIKSHA